MLRPTAFLASLVALALAAPLPAFAQSAQGAATEKPKPAARKPAPKKPPAEAADQESEAPAEAAGKARGRGRAAAKSTAPATAPANLQASPVGAFGDWSVFAAGQGRARICYAISQPKNRLPKTLKRDPAYLFVTVRKAENVPNELALMMGFAVKPGGGPTAAAGTPPPARSPSDPTLAIGSATYGLVVKDTNAWLQNPADEGRVVGEMSRASKLVVKANSLRGNASTDEYSLAGFGDAIKRTREECK